MYVPPNEMTGSARVWIYSADRFLTDDEVSSIREELLEFVQKWTAHNHNLKATVSIRFNRHIVLAVDEALAQASGCSIDSSVKFIQQLGAKYHFDGLDRLQYTYLDHQEPKLISHHNIVKAFEGGAIQPNTLIANPLIKTWEEYTSKFIIPLKDSFLSRFLDLSKV